MRPPYVINLGVRTFLQAQPYLNKTSADTRGYRSST